MPVDLRVHDPVGVVAAVREAGQAAHVLGDGAMVEIHVYIRHLPLHRLLEGVAGGV